MLHALCQGIELKKNAKQDVVPAFMGLPCLNPQVATCPAYAGELGGPSEGSVE